MCNIRDRTEEKRRVSLTPCFCFLQANLFKLQLGGARHWNIYTHSFLYFGVNGAWERYAASIRQR